MKLLILGVWVSIALYAFYDIFKHSKYNRFANLSNLIVIVGLSILLGFVPLYQKTLEFNSTQNTITITN